MKIQIVIIPALVLSLFSSIGWTKSFDCSAGRLDLIHFKAAFVSHQKIIIEFDKLQGPLGQNVAGSSVTLRKEDSSSTGGWLYFSGRVKVTRIFSDFVHFRLGYVNGSLAHDTFLGNFAMSPLSLPDRPRWMSQMSLSCSEKAAH